MVDTRIHWTTKRHEGRVCREEERAAALPLPAGRFPMCQQGQRWVIREWRESRLGAPAGTGKSHLAQGIGVAAIPAVSRCSTGQSSTRCGISCTTRRCRGGS